MPLDPPPRRREVPLVDPFADVPAFDADQPTTTLAVHSTRRLTPLEIKELIREKAYQLLHAQQHELRTLNIEIQRLRLTRMLLTEAESDQGDPDFQKELKQLETMLHGVEDDEDAGDDAIEAKQSEALLAARGMNPERARQILRVLESVSAAPEDARGPAVSPDTLARTVSPRRRAH